MAGNYFDGAYSDVSNFGYNSMEPSPPSLGVNTSYSGGGYNHDSIGTGSYGDVMAAGMFTQMFSTIISTFSQIGAIESQSQYKQHQLEFNAQMADLQASSAITDGEREAQKYETAGNQAVGEVRSSSGAQGIEVNAGSSAAVQESSKTMSLLDALTVRNNAARRAFGYRVAAINDRGEAAYTQLEASNKERSTLISGGLTGLSEGLKGGYYYGGGPITDRTRSTK